MRTTYCFKYNNTSLPVNMFVDVENRTFYFKAEHVVSCLKLNDKTNWRLSLEQEFGADSFKYFPFSETNEPFSATSKPTFWLTEAQVYYLIGLFNSQEAHWFRLWFIDRIESLKTILFNKLFYKQRLEIKREICKEIANRLDDFLDSYSYE